MLLDAARRALDLATTETLVSVRRDRALRIAGDDEPRTREGTVLEVASVVDGHAGVGTATTLDEQAIRAAVDDARREAESAARSGAGRYPGLPQPLPPRPHDGFDVETATLTAEAARRRLADLPEGSALAAGETRVAAVSSRGLEATDAVTVARATITVADGLVAQSTARAVDALVLGALAARAAWLAAAAAGSADGDTVDGTVPVVIGPEALAPLLGIAGAAVFDGLAHARGEGPLAGRLGTRVGAATINLSDSPGFGLTLPRGFDAEGVPKAPLPLVQDGVAHRVVHDVHSAAVAGAGASTGHAISKCGTAPPAPRNLVLVGGGAQDEDELAAGIGQGVFLPRLESVTVADPATARFTADAPAAMRIREGRIAGRTGPLRVEGELLALLSAVEALTSRPRLVAVARDWGVVAPAARLRELRVVAAG